jgi:2-polyprenyl-3-methyl-5-hydroxy-6-metoxy-1,4-benzoquinol methylase
MKKLLILITAYNVESFIKKVINRIPHNELKKKIEYSILIIDDKSRDKTREEILKLKQENNFLNINFLFNYKNQGYGGNQKIGYHYAIKNNFDFVILLHGDGQYAPEKIIDILNAFDNLEADAVQGSRMINKFDALKGKMPIYKFFGNIGLTSIQNLLTGLKMSEFHSGYRAYKISALKQIPFQLNSNQFHFDTEIFLQLTLAKKKIVEVPIPTFYGEEISSLKSINYGFAILKTTLIFYLQKFSIFYDRKYNLENFDIIQKEKIFKKDNNEKYESKLNFDSTHSRVIKKIKNQSKILSLGCGNAYVENFLKNNKDCYINGIDNFSSSGIKSLNEHSIEDLNNYNFDINLEGYDYVLLLDVIEHLHNPENFMNKLYDAMSLNPDCKLLISTPNVANIFIRFMLFFGKFNYGQRGILDKTHTRLFTKKTFVKILEENNFSVLNTEYIPIPFPLIIKNKLFVSFIMKIQNILNKINGKLFSFEILCESEAYPSLDFLIKKN